MKNVEFQFRWTCPQTCWTYFLDLIHFVSVPAVWATFIPSTFRFCTLYGPPSSHQHFRKIPFLYQLYGPPSSHQHCGKNLLLYQLDGPPSSHGHFMGMIEAQEGPGQAQGGPKKAPWLPKGGPRSRLNFIKSLKIVGNMCKMGHV